MLGDDGVGRSGVQRYSPGVLIGNWYEEMRQKEDKLKLFEQKKQRANFKPATRGGLDAVTIQAIAASLSQPVRLSIPAGSQSKKSAYAAGEEEDPDLPPCVPMRTPLLILSQKMSGAVALDPTSSKHTDGFTALLTATADTVPSIRSTWCVFPCADENNAAYHHSGNPNILHYGQHVRIGNENASAVVSGGGCYYVQSDLTSGHYAMNQQPASAGMGETSTSVFVIGRPAHRRGDPTSDGLPVRLGDPIVLIHSLTNQPLCCSGDVSTSTAFGLEWGLTCHLTRRHHSFSRGAVGVCEDNIFTFSVGSESDGPKLRSTLQEAVSHEELLPMSCGDGVERVLCRIRDGAVKLGGRLGLRALSLALRTAGAEGRYPQYLNRQGLVSHISKLGVFILPVELDAIMRRFDHEGNGLIATQEFMRDLRGDMPPERMKAVVKAFQSLLIEGKGAVDFKDMLHLYRENAYGHPDVHDGLATREEICGDFEVSWPSNIIDTKLGTVRLDEFVEYYTDISPAVYDDRRFIMTLRNVWMIPLTDDYLKGVPIRVITVLHDNDEKEDVRIPDSLPLDVENREQVKALLIAHGMKNIKDFRVSRRM